MNFEGPIVPDKLPLGQKALHSFTESRKKTKCWLDGRKQTEGCDGKHQNRRRQRGRSKGLNQKKDCRFEFLQTQCELFVREVSLLLFQLLSVCFCFLNDLQPRVPLQSPSELHTWLLIHWSCDLEGWQWNTAERAVRFKTVEAGKQIGRKTKHRSTFTLVG